MSSKDLVNKHKEHKFESEISSIEFRLTESMTNLDMLDNELTNKLYIALDHALSELIQVQKHIKNGTKPFKLPVGYRAKMEVSLTEACAEGRDYSGYTYEAAENEVNSMDDEQFFDCFEQYFEDYDEDSEEYQILQTLKDITDKEKLLEVINE